METVTFELKSTGDSGPGTFEGIMSSPVLDRDGEIIDALAFAPLPKHITIDIDHGLTVEKTVGSGEPYYDADGILKVKGTFASTPLGQVTRTLVKEGHIRHMSVAFRDALRELDEASGVTHIRKGELINCTITGIPANTATAVVAKVGARNSMKDAERIQTMHDYAIELGATCGEKCAHGFATGGVIPPGKTYLVGERGIEYFTAAAGTGNTIKYVIGANGISMPATDTKSTDTETPTAPVEETAPAGAEVDVARAQALLTLARAALALE